MPYADSTVRAAYLRAWKRRNRGRYKAEAKIYDATKHANERARMYGVTGTLTQEDVRAALAAGRCSYCGTSERLGIDHIEPLHAGGPNTPSNIVAACVPCNVSKWRQDRPGRWARHHERCVDCQTIDRRHLAKGRCTRCYARERKRVEKGRAAFDCRSRVPDG
jgi:5-methylcytosine-specific restriction endonuclease McrA